MAQKVLHILMVDDTRSQYEMVDDFLQFVTTSEIKYIVEWASTYGRGIELIHDKTYDVCLIDYELGDRTGLEFIKHVVEHEIPVPMILLTGHGSYKVDLEAMQAGAVDYLDKINLKSDTLERSIRYATQNQRMLDREREQRTITEALLDTALALNSSLEFDEVLERILSNMKHVIPHDAANILLIEDQMANLARYRGYTDEQVANIDELLDHKVTEIPSFKQMLQTQQPILENDIASSEPWVSIKGAKDFKAYLGVPIVIHEEVIGFLNFDGNSKNQFTEEHAHYAQIFAQQAAQAIRNTQALQQAKVLAATQTRQRLARDLHDAVSQTLFSSSVIAQTLPRFIETDPEQVKDGLEDLYRLNRGALAEMRTLLVELRPQALIDTDLPTLIRNLVNAFNSRSQTSVESRINYTDTLPEDIHIAFYRIAQESLNNIQKYAQASHVTIDLIQSNSHLDLRIADNGIGFDTQAVPPGHYGLKIMKERANDIGGELIVESVIGSGTTIQLVWHMNNGGNHHDE